MEHFVFNAASAKLVVKGGRQFYIADMALINPGVLAGSKGPLYYSPEECARNASDWDGTPIVRNHPADPSGNPISASHPSVNTIGYLANTHFDGKLRSKGWFDVDKMRKSDPDILQALQAGRSMEISTGLYTSNVPAPMGATHNGRPYAFYAREYRPDHLAILPNATGACSIQDGCGLLVNKRLPKFLGVNRRMAAGTAAEEVIPHFSGGDEKKQGCGDGG